MVSKFPPIPPPCKGFRGSPPDSLLTHNRDPFVRKSVTLVDEMVNLLVRRGDLELHTAARVRRSRFTRQLKAQVPSSEAWDTSDEETVSSLHSRTCFNGAALVDSEVLGEICLAFSISTRPRPPTVNRQLEGALYITLRSAKRSSIALYLSFEAGSHSMDP